MSATAEEPERPLDVHEPGCQASAATLRARPSCLEHQPPRSRPMSANADLTFGAAMDTAQGRPPGEDRGRACDPPLGSPTAGSSPGRTLDASAPERDRPGMGRGAAGRVAIWAYRVILLGLLAGTAVGVFLAHLRHFT